MQASGEVGRDTLIGKQIRQYRVLRQLGEGGMGVVYEAFREDIGQRVAIKILAARLVSDRLHVERFLREARALSAIDDPGIAAVHDFGQLPDGLPFLIMEYVEGETLRSRLDRDPDRSSWSLPQVLDIVWQMANTLCTAHEKGIIHRDLKPDNVILKPQTRTMQGDRVKILDFGIARFLDVPDLTPITGPKTAIGTPRYMSPEQCQPGMQVDALTDVYSLGVIFYEMLCGSAPFSGPEVLIHKLFVDARPPIELNPTIPAEVNGLVCRMLSRPAALRPSMSEVAESIQALELTAPVSLVSGRRPVVSMASSPTNTGTSERPADGNSSPGRPGKRFGIRLALLCVMSMTILGFLFQLARSGFILPLARSLWAPSGMVLIPEGVFKMGSEPSDLQTTLDWAKRSGCEDCKEELYMREFPPHQQQVSSFYLDKTEVTNEQYAAWLDRQANLQRQGTFVWRGSTYLLDLKDGIGYAGIQFNENHYVARRGLEKRPVAQVTWDGALSYCQAQGKRLPTEAEWEYAAGGKEGTRFPWGEDPPSCDWAVFGRINKQPCHHLGDSTADVGTSAKDRSPLGVFDLGGNVAEWVMDRFVDRYPQCAGPCPDLGDRDTESPSGGPDIRVMRGGAWYRGAESTRSAGRGMRDRRLPIGDLGFRCAKPIKK